MEHKKDFGVTPPTWIKLKAETESEPDIAKTNPKRTPTTHVALNVQDISLKPQPKNTEAQPCGDVVLKMHKASFDFPEVVLPCAYANQTGDNLAIGSAYWVVLGRAPDVLRHTGMCLVIPDPTVSRTHAAILNLEGCLYVCDLSERNPPTIIRGNKLIYATHEPTSLFTTDYLGLGGVLFTFTEMPRRPTN
jgi:hypothetical protein